MNASRLMVAARKALGNFPKCGALARSTGQPCRKPGLGSGGRCRHHGGLSTGRPTLHGNFTRERMLGNDWCRLLLGLIYEIHGKPETSSGWIKPGRLTKARICELLLWQGIDPPNDM
jgi:hypothetical protein